MASDNNMNRRGTNGRKSLSVTSSNPSLRERGKKRAYSMAPGPSKAEDDLTPRRRQRRSLARQIPLPLCIRLPPNLCRCPPVES
jgi:hypothetical protein